MVIITRLGVYFFAFFKIGWCFINGSPLAVNAAYWFVCGKSFFIFTFDEHRSFDGFLLDAGHAA